MSKSNISNTFYMNDPKKEVGDFSINRRDFKVSKDELRDKVVNVAHAKSVLERLSNPLWRHCSQNRRFKNVENFHHYNLPALFFASNLIYPSFDKTATDYEELKQVVCISKIAGDNNFPLFFAHNEVVSACMNSKTLDSVEWSTMKLPFESMTFILPLNLIKISDFDIAFLMITRLPKGDLSIPFTKEQIRVPRQCLIVNAVSTTLTNFRVVLQDDFVPGNIQTAKIRDGNPFEIDLDECEEIFINQMTSLVFNLIFVMEARPQLVECGVKISHHKKSGEDVWTANHIGAKYRSQKSETLGSHSSPRLHWRRGHFRKQNIGKRSCLCTCGHFESKHNDSKFYGDSHCVDCSCSDYTFSKAVFSETKTLWIEPILIGKES